MNENPTTEHDPIAPHGGVLVDRTTPEGEREARLRDAEKLPALTLHTREISDLELIAVGAFSPLRGFMGRADYESVVARGRLADGLPWTIPVTLSATTDEAAKMAEGSDVALTHPDGFVMGLLHLREKFAWDREREADHVYRTRDRAHPAVAYMFGEMGDVLLGGDVTLLRATPPAFPAHARTPAQTRALFRERGWKRIVAFQTRNPVHRAHEYIQKCALEICDGLLLHPIVGFTKDDDIPAPVRMRCYEVLLENYYPADRVVLSTLPAAMRYGGPKEAIFHALVRKNYGCTHFIVGRDHAGVGTYYGTYDAQKMFDAYEPAELGITPLRFDNTFFCRRCGGMASLKTCSHPPTEHATLSGTKVRELLRAGQAPPPEFSRLEVANVLIDAMRAS
ncbi:MAG: sulfate adenylyltransferase, partial [Myxococcota bacterium]